MRTYFSILCLCAALVGGAHAQTTDGANDPPPDFKTPTILHIYFAPGWTTVQDARLNHFGAGVGAQQMVNGWASADVDLAGFHPSPKPAAPSADYTTFTVGGALHPDHLSAWRLRGIDPFIGLGYAAVLAHSALETPAHAASGQAGYWKAGVNGWFRDRVGLLLGFQEVVHGRDRLNAFQIGVSFR